MTESAASSSTASRFWGCLVVDLAAAAACFGLATALVAKVSKIGVLESSLVHAAVSGHRPLFELALVAAVGIWGGRDQYKALGPGGSRSPVIWSAAVALIFIVGGGVSAFGQSTPIVAAAKGIHVYESGVGQLVFYGEVALAVSLVVGCLEAWRQYRVRQAQAQAAK